MTAADTHTATGPAADIAATANLAPVGDKEAPVYKSGEHSATGPAPDITASSGVAPVGHTIGAVPPEK